MTGDNQPPPHIHSVLPSISISISIADAAAMYANGTDLKDPYLSPGASVCVFLARPPPSPGCIICTACVPPHPSLPFPSLAHTILPVYGDLGGGFPPSLLMTGTRDLFLSNTVRVHRSLRQANVPADLHVFEGACQDACERGWEWILTFRTRSFVVAELLPFPFPSFPPIRPLARAAHPDGRPRPAVAGPAPGDSGRPPGGGRVFRAHPRRREAEEEEEGGGRRRQAVKQAKGRMYNKLVKVYFRLFYCCRVVSLSF